MNMGDAMMLGRGRCCEGTAENNSSGKRNYRLTAHLRISWLSRCGATRNGLVISGTQEKLAKRFVYSSPSNKVDAHVSSAIRRASLG
jgi:hypothetical protein